MYSLVSGSLRAHFCVHLKNPPCKGGFFVFRRILYETLFDFPEARRGRKNMLALGLNFAVGPKQSENAPPPAPVIPLRTVVTHNRVQSGSEARGVKDRQCFRYPYVIACDCSELVISNNAWALSGTVEELVPNSFSVLEMSLELNGTVVPVRYGGARNKALASGDVDVQSDPVLPSSYGLSKFSYGDVIWLKGIVSCPAGGNLPVTPARFDAYTGGQVFWWTSSINTVSSTDVAGTYTVTGGSTDTRITGYRPIVLGRPLADGPSFITVGDSIGESMTDNDYLMTSSTDPLKMHGLAFVQRSMRAATNTSFLPSLNMARSATSPSAVVNGTRVKKFYKYARFGIDEYGTNAVPPTFGGDLGPLQTTFRTLWSEMRSAGIEKIIRTKLLPRCNSTDSFMTVANQTPHANWGAGAPADLLNQWFDAELLAGRIDSVVAMNNVRSSADPHKWKTDSPETTANFTAADGTHPSGRGHELMAQELRPVLRSLT